MTRHRLGLCLCRNAPNGYFKFVGNIWLLPAILELLEFLEVTFTPKNTSKPSKSIVIKSLVLSTTL